MSSLLIKPIVQHHRSRVSPIQLRDFPLHQWGNLTVKDPAQHTINSGRKKKVNRRFLEPVRASYGDDCVWKNWEFRNHLELVKEQGLGRKDSTQQEAGV